MLKTKNLLLVSLLSVLLVACSSPAKSAPPVVVKKSASEIQKEVIVINPTPHINKAKSLKKMTDDAAAKQQKMIDDLFNQ